MRISDWSSDVCSPDLPLLRRAANGRLLALSTGVARTPRAYWGAYAASKAALEGLVTSYGAEMRNISNVRIAILEDRKSVVSGKSVSGRVDLGGSSLVNKTNTNNKLQTSNIRKR